ncbi:MAG: ferritin-like domain-containing protein [Myxococcota bacterium]
MVLDVREQARARAPRIEADPALVNVAINTWRARMINETRSAEVFEALADQLAVAGLDEAGVARCRSFADEERLHGVLCGAVVEALGGEARSELPPDAPVPEHADVGRLEAALRNLLSICCLSETVAVALIGFERESLPEGELKELLTEIYADECGHANFGWRRLPGLLPDDPEMKQRLGDYLAVAFAHLEAHELAHLPAGPGIPGGEALGLCDGAEARALLAAAVHEVIIPGLESHGLPAQAAWDRRGAVQADLARQAETRVNEVHQAAFDH